MSSGKSTSRYALNSYVRSANQPSRVAECAKIRAALMNGLLTLLALPNNPVTWALRRISAPF